MRLIIDGRRLASGRTGVGRYLEGLLAEWAASGPPLPETVVVLKEPSGLDYVPAGPGLRAEVVGTRLPGLLWERLGLGGVLRPDDLLFAPTNLIPGHWRGRAVLVLFDLLQEIRPGDFPWHAHLRFGRRYRRAARRAEVVIVPSEATARDAVRYYGVPAGRLRVIYPGIDPAFHRAGPPDRGERAAREALGLGDAPYVLFVGKRSRRRHIPEILAAFDLHRRAFPGHRLVFTGQPSGRGRGPGDPARGILDAGHVPEPVLRGLMAGALALLYPSAAEGFGLPVVEAMACGCPVVALRGGALAESGGEAAWYIDRPTPGDLAAALRTIATDPRARADYVARGLAQAARFDRARFAAAVKRELIAAADRPAPPRVGC